jgi:hypothetical protein
MRVFIFLCAGVLVAGAAFAQEAPLARVYGCAALPKADERLACYDGAVASLKQAETAGVVAVISRAQVTEASERAFGFKKTEAADIARAAGIAVPKAAEQLDNVQVKIATAEKQADGKYRFTLESGQVWDQIETEKVGRLGALPVTAEIKAAALGSFLMRIEGGRAIRVRRVK